MGKLALSVAIGDYDRTRPLIDGKVQIDGVDPVIMTLSPEEIFFRAFRHTSIYVAKDRIKRPQDLIGKRIGVGEYQLTANVWARALLAEHGVSRSDIVWVRR